jgi:nicotinic acid mononucleotide adenylyltransferase
MSIYFSPHTLRRFGRVQALLDQLQPEAESRACIVPGSPMPQRGVIVFPGSFNPPTTAHIALLKQAQEFAHRQQEALQLYAAFSKHTVDKESVERPLLLDRVMLLERLLRNRLPQVGIMLFNRGLYVEQAEAVRRSFPRVRRILFLIGFDKIVQILDPRYYQDRDAALVELFQLAEFLVAPRGNDGEKELSALLHQPQNVRSASYVHPLPFNPIYRNVSSTAIRRQAAGVATDVPREVQEFMRETRAYAPPLQRRDGATVDYYGQRVQTLTQLLGQQGVMRTRHGT